MKVEECIGLRQRLAETQQELERCQLLLRKQENMTTSRNDELIKTQHSLDIVLKELHSKKQLGESLQQENLRLKRDLESAQKHSGEVTKALQSKSVTKGPGSGLFGVGDANKGETLMSMYIQQCFQARCDPHTDVVRGLYQGSAIEAVAADAPVSFLQLNSLMEVLDTYRTYGTNVLDPMAVSVTRLALRVDSQEAFQIVSHIIRENKSIKDVELHGLGNLMAQEVASTLAIAEHVGSLSLPDLKVSDTGFQSIMKVIKNREDLFHVEKEKYDKQVADAKAASNDALVEHLHAKGPAKQLIALRDLDLSHSMVSEAKSFELINGISFLRLNLSGCEFLADCHLGEMIRSCPHLQALTLSNCPRLSNDSVSFINTLRSITYVNVVGCVGVSKLNFLYVETLETDLNGVSHLECPKLVALPIPVVHFRLVSLVAPSLLELTIKNLSLSSRELQMLSDSSKDLRQLRFVCCRLSGVDFFLRMMRRLEDVSFHGCKGISDVDVMCLCSKIKVLDLTENYTLTDKCMKYVADTCAGLTHLTLKRCANITDLGVQHLVNHASLEYLNVLGVKKVTIVALHRVIASLPSVKRIVHETLVSSTIQVDRDDVEEAEKVMISAEQMNLLAKRDVAALTYVSSSSPVRTERSGTTEPRTPKPPATDSNAASPQSRKASAHQSLSADLLEAAESK